ncbi:MAG: hypothetical protein OEY23_18125, partial [Acidimicrobiia bacterium]|nr:hypothetical protein [Acidimicrobiia bacterium]
MIDPASLAAVSWGAPAGADAPALAAIVGAGLARATLSAIGQVIIVASVAALAVILVPQRLRPPERGARIGRSIDRPRFLADPAGGPHPWEPEEGRVGIACSGGGLRSASFCLGALQVLRRRGVLGRARYVAAVSGGSYIAGAFAIAEGERRMAAERARAEVDPPERDPLDGSAGALDGSAGALAGVADDAGIELDLRDRDLDNEGDGGGDASPTPGAMASGVGATAPFDSDSPEERWLRTNSNYLAPDVLTGARGAARLLAGLGVNLLLVWLVLFVVARPVGWLISAPGLHPELRSREPFVTFERQPTPVDVTLEPLANPGPDGSQFLIHVAFQPAQARLTGDRWPDRSTSVNLVEERPGLGGIIDGRFSVIRQPDLAVLDPVQGASVNGDGSDSIYVRHDPRVRYVGPPLNPAADPPSAQQLQGDLEVIELPELAQRSALSGRPPITFEPWMRLVCVVAAAIALLAYVVRVMFRPLRPAAVRASELAVIVAVVVAAGSFTVLVALPYLAAHLDGWLRRWTEALPLFAAPTATNGWSIADSLPAVVGFLTLALSALRSVLARSSAARPLQLLRYVSALVVPLVGLALFVQIVVYGAANGPFGTLVGFGLGTQPLPDWSRWLLVVGALLALRHAADAHAWSLGPYYARRLNSAFALRRVEGRPDHAEEVPYHEKGLWFTDHGTLGPAADPDAAGPQLVVCAAANVRDREAAPPGRPAVSFTFSSSEVGGPQTGWIPTPHLQAAMAHRRRRDLTVLAALGISGAAVSPAMGKLSLGP